MANPRTYLLILWISLLGCYTRAQQHAVADSKSLLWRISGNRLEQPSYLFGTLHIICPDEYLWTEKMKLALDSSDKVCFELDLSDPALKMNTIKNMIDTSGKKLADYFTPDEYNEVKRYFKDSLNKDLENTYMQSFKPYMLLLLINSKFTGCKRTVSYEKRILKTAKKQGKRVDGLETPADEISAMDSRPGEQVIKGLVTIAEGKVNGYAIYQKMLDMYKKQDLPLLYKFAKQSIGIVAKDELLDERNKKWEPRMELKMQHTSVFFAVGAGHLWGNEGVISLLQKAGYTVEPLRDTANIGYTESEDTTSSQVYMSKQVDKMPKADYDIPQYLAAHIHYPRKAIKKNIEGRVLVQFVVNEGGNITDCRVKKGADSSLDDEALRVVGNMPPWQPGMKDGKPVKVFFTLPVTFALN